MADSKEQSDSSSGTAEDSERLARLVNILRCGDFSAFEGEAEGARFECKKIPYDLDRDGSQLELAKDITSFANSGGGLIVIGLETVRVSERAADVVKTVRPFPRELFNIQRYQSLFDVHIYPRIEGLTLDWHPSRTLSSEGLASILVPRQAELHQPFLVTKIIDNQGKVRGTMLGYFERHRDGVTHKDAKDFYYLIRAGRMKDEFGMRIGAIEATISDSQRKAALSSTSASQLTIAPTSSTSEIFQRVNTAISIARLSGRPTYVLFARPLGALSIPDLFSSQQSPVKKLLESPPEVRNGGFGVDAGNRAMIVEGRLRRALDIESNRNLELWRDGVLIFVAPANEEFLCWGRRQPPPLIINSIALLESLYLFSALVAAIQQYTEPKNCGMELSFHLRGSEAAHRLNLRAGPVGGL